MRVPSFGGFFKTRTPQRRENLQGLPRPDGPECYPWSISTAVVLKMNEGRASVPLNPTPTAPRPRPWGMAGNVWRLRGCGTRQYYWHLPGRRWGCCQTSCYTPGSALSNVHRAVLCRPVHTTVGALTLTGHQHPWEAWF